MYIDTRFVVTCCRIDAKRHDYQRLYQIGEKRKQA